MAAVGAFSPFFGLKKLIFDFHADIGVMASVVEVRLGHIHIHSRVMFNWKQGRIQGVKWECKHHPR